MRNRRCIVALVTALVLGLIAVPSASAAPRFTVLVFSKVNGYYHDSIPAGQQAITELGAQEGFEVVVSDDATLFTDTGLARFDAVVFNNTNGRDGAILDASQRAAFERYIQAGGGYTGIHSASGIEYDWAWYGSLMGAFFDKHPAIQPLKVQVDDRTHPSTRNLPQIWERTEEPYDFRTNPRGSVHVLASYDTRSYTGQTMGADHPISWCQNFEGGRSWYTGIGHAAADYGDARNDDPLRGPMGYDEFNVAKEAGNFGWPMCIGKNRAYVEYDFTTGQSAQPYDCAGGPTNNSPNNTGLEKLPPAQPAWLQYPYSVSDEWPELGTGSRLAIGGPTYRYDPELESETKFPEYYDDTTFIAEWTRNAMFEVKKDDSNDGTAGNALSLNRFLGRTPFLRPIDMEFGPDGSLYVIEWGTNYGGSGRGEPNWDSGIYRIDYIRPGERSPIPKATASPSSGKAPLTVQFTDRSTDPDGQPLSHEWDFDGDGTVDSREANPVHTFTENGTHLARLIVTDPTGRREPVNVKVTVGNTAPKVTFQTPRDGDVFDWGVPIPYQLRVTDADGGVNCEEPLTKGGVGHARQVHPVSQNRGCAGELVPAPVEGHTAADDLTYVLDASYTDTGRPRLTDRATVTLQPRRKEAEHYDRSSGIRVVRNSEGGGLVAGVSNGDWLSVTPVNLRNVGTLKFRVASAANGGTVEVRFGAPDGPLLGSVAVPVTGGGQIWTEVTAPVVDPGSTHELFLVAKNPGTTGDLFNVDWFEFGPEV